jgi:hypothetical protein
MPVTYKPNAIEPMPACPHAVADAVLAKAVELGFDVPTVTAVSSWWLRYVTETYARGELARRKLDIVQMAADAPNMN